MSLPPGQRATQRLRRFGLSPFAYRFPSNIETIEIAIDGRVERDIVVRDLAEMLPRHELVADFHCVTTWSVSNLHWSGFRFADFYSQIIVPRAGPGAGAELVELKAQDGYRTSLPVADLLNDEVLLADRLADQPLSLAHGAPLRLIAPAHYGYKNIKHLDRIRFHTIDSKPRPIGFRFMAHPRARVAEEERGRWVPGLVLRWLYRPLIGPTARRFEKAIRSFDKSER